MLITTAIYRQKVILNFHQSINSITAQLHIITMITNSIDKHDLKNSLKMLITNAIYSQKLITKFN